MPSNDRKPVVPAAILALCPDLKDIPANETPEQSWQSRGRDRAAYADCRSKNAAKAAVIKAYGE